MNIFDKQKSGNMSEYERLVIQITNSIRNAYGRLSYTEAETIAKHLMREGWIK